MIIKDTIRDYGIPECLYTDYRTVFKSNKKELTLKEELQGKEIKNTRFANMLNHIGIDIISIVDPRSKGRIERLC
ncbi:MAG: transposase family protein [Bacilli bacterium]|nr:transposase family protein [Bacilli bacterium]